MNLFGWFSNDPQVRVARGVKWLDREHEGWVLLINTDRLDLADPRDCVLGQVSGRNYNDELDRTGHGPTWATRHGFNGDIDRGAWRDLGELEEEWRQVIALRRGAEILSA